MKNKLFKTCLTGLALSVAGLANAQVAVIAGEQLVPMTHFNSHAVISGAAVIITAGSTVDSNIAAQAAVGIGAESCTQDISAGAAVVIGANSTVGNINSGAATGIGAGAKAKAIESGAATVLGANAQVDSVLSGSTVLGAGAYIHSDHYSDSMDSDDCPVLVTTGGLSAADMADTITDIGNVQAALSNRNIVGSNELFTTMVGYTSLLPGTHHGTELTIAAGSEIVFNNPDRINNPVWVINLTAALTVGAGTTFDFDYNIDENGPPTIIWNVGAAITLGAGTEFIGVAFANGAFTAATSEVFCGNIYAKGAVAVGHLKSSNADAGCGLRPSPVAISASSGIFEYSDAVGAPAISCGDFAIELSIVVSNVYTDRANSTSDVDEIRVVVPIGGGGGAGVEVTYVNYIGFDLISVKLVVDVDNVSAGSLECKDDILIP
jgi:hypothetical protein